MSNIGDTWFEFQTYADDKELQYLAKITIVDVNTVDMTSDADGTVRFVEKQTPENIIKKLTSHDKFRTEPEGDMLRIYALRDINNGNMTVSAGDRGGLISAPLCLSQAGDCWIDEDAEVHAPAFVCGDAEVYGSSVIKGHASIRNDVAVDNSTITGTVILCESVHVVDSVLNANESMIRVEGDTVIADSTLAARADGPIHVRGGRFLLAALRDEYDAVSVWTRRWGYLTVFRTATGMQVTIGCQVLCSLNELRNLGAEYLATAKEHAMLEGFISMAQAAAAEWHPSVVVEESSADA